MSLANISSSAEYPERLHRFTRQRTDREWVDLDQLPHRASVLEIVGNTAGFIVFLCACVALMCWH